MKIQYSFFVTVFVPIFGYYFQDNQNFVSAVKKAKLDMEQYVIVLTDGVARAEMGSNWFSTEGNAEASSKVLYDNCIIVSFECYKSDKRV